LRQLAASAGGGGTVRRLARGGRAAARRAGGALCELLVRGAAAAAPADAAPPAVPESIFVLRNNDLGDLLVITPLFEALRRRFPAARIVAGIGDWGREVLRHNPHVSEVVAVNAPWFNKYRHGRGPAAPLRYVWRSPEARALARRRFAVGIDVLGSAWGALLLARAGIPYRLGVRGYAGGHSAAQATVEFDPALHVGRAALRFAELLGATELPESRPQIFLDGAEVARAERRWNEAAGAGQPPDRPGGLGRAPGGPGRESGTLAGSDRTPGALAVPRRAPRVLVGPGGGLAARRWPAASFAGLVGLLGAAGPLTVLVAGGPGEEELTRQVAAADPSARALLPAPGLREVFALAAAADLVLCNSSMLLHAAAAFRRPTVVLLGAAFPSAREHHAQWGYSGRCRSLGREPGTGDRLATPEEAFAAAREEIAQWS
jgi:ADP-heptose:LPS heptosyltransferase